MTVLTRAAAFLIKQEEDRRRELERQREHDYVCATPPPVQYETPQSSPRPYLPHEDRHAGEKEMCFRYSHPSDWESDDESPKKKVNQMKMIKMQLHLVQLFLSMVTGLTQNAGQILKKKVIITA